jgi:hypothetical protein
MQKKLYFLNEEEKNRILNLHESRTKKQYLIIEQEVAQSTLYKQKNEIAWDKFLKNIKNSLKGYCEKNQSGKVDPGTLTNFKNAVEERYYGSAGMSYETYNDLINSIDSIPNQNICAIDKRFVRDYNIGLIDKIMNSIRELNSKIKFLKKINSKFGGDNQGLNFGEFDEEVPSGVEAANAETATTDTSTTETGWADPKFVCVKNIPTMTDAPETKYSKLNKGYYFLDGGYLAQSDYDKGKEYSGSFYCDKLGKIKYKPNEYPTGQKEETKKETAVEKKTGEQEKSYTPPVASGIGTTTRSVSKEIPTLLKQVGVEGTSLTQDAINKLYDKLSKKA